MIEVTLSPMEVEIARLVSWRINENYGRHNQTMDGGRNKYLVNPDAYGAEMAVAKMLNVYVDHTVSKRIGGADYNLLPNITADTKQTDKDDGNLVANINKKPEDADVYILAIGVLPTYQVVGWCLNYQLINPDQVVTRMVNGMETQFYLRKREDLYPIEYLTGGEPVILSEIKR